MLTVLKVFMPKHKDALYGIMVDYCLVNVDYYMNTDIEKCAYWTKQACKYMLKRIDKLKFFNKSFM